MGTPYVCTSCRYILQRQRQRLRPSANVFSRWEMQSRNQNQRLPYDKRGFSTDRNRSSPGVYERHSSIKDVQKRHLLGLESRQRNEITRAPPPTESFSDFDLLEKEFENPDMDIATYYGKYEAFFQKYQLRDMPSLSLVVARSRLPRRVLQQVIQAQTKVANLPSPEDLLESYCNRGIDNEYIWSDVMFDYLRKEQDDDVFLLWSRYMHRLTLQNIQLGDSVTSLNPSAQFTPILDPNEKMQPPSPASYPIAAAIAAYHNSEYKNLIVPSLPGLLKVLTFNDIIIPSKRPYIPSLGTMYRIFNQYDVSQTLVQQIAMSMRNIRPYGEEEEDKTEVSFLDEIYTAGSTKDEVKLIHMYRNRTNYKHSTSVYTAFINGFMHCGKADAAVHIWNDMIRMMKAEKKGTVPQLRTWGALLDGCAKSKNLDLFDKTWTKLVASGLTPDEKCWTMRLQMLFSASRPDLAKGCLQDMLQRQIPITTGIINAVVSGLDSRKFYEDSARILKWATDEGIPGDVITFNLVLRSQIRQGKVSEANQTLGRMLAANIAPDIITYSEIVSGMYMHAPAPLPIDAVKNILDEMAKRNITPNLHFFNSIINCILRKFSDIQAAHDILNLMPDPSWRTSAITSNLFIQHHLVHHEFAAVDALWGRMRLEKVVPDPALYNVTIKGYAMAGKRERMLYWLGEMLKDLKQPTLATYIWILRCLGRENDLQTASEVVTDVLNKGLDIRMSRELNSVIAELREKGMVHRMSPMKQHRAWANLKTVNKIRKGW